MNFSNEILASWKANADNWIATIENNELESRRLVTNKAIVDEVLKYKPKKVLDLGCGEGWLSRLLRNHGVDAWGVDAIEELVEKAIANDGPFYFRHTYEEIAEGKHNLPGPFDLIVCNFALLDKEGTEKLLTCLPSLLEHEGYLVIQTLHSLAIAATEDYKTGWKEGSWKGLKREFVMPYQWYFRTLEDWVKLFIQSGFQLENLSEPVHPETHKPVSFIFVLKATKSS